MLMAIKNFVNFFSEPIVSFTFMTIIFPFIFPPTDWFEKKHRQFGFNKLWTNTGGYFIFLILILFFVIGYLDPHFNKILSKPDNFPIVLLIFSMFFYVWFSMKKAYNNDKRLSEGNKPVEYHDPEDKVLVWPDLVYIEFIALLLFMAFLIIW